MFDKLGNICFLVTKFPCNYLTFERTSKTCHSGQKMGQKCYSIHLPRMDVRRPILCELPSNSYLEKGRDKFEMSPLSIVSPFALAFDSCRCVQSTLIFSLNFHLIGEWHDKRELVQLNGLIETEGFTTTTTTRF